MNAHPTHPGSENTSAGPANGAARPSPAPRFDFWRTTHRALRGRYRLGIALALCGAALGAYVGFGMGKRLYTATGLVRVASVLPQVLRETDQNKPIAMFDGFIQAQREVMAGREVLEGAMKEEPWQEIVRSGRALSDEQFAAGLKVETRQRSDHIRVTYIHKDPAVATAAVRSIIASYQRAFTRERERLEGERMGQLQTRRGALASELADLETEMKGIAGGSTAAELEPEYNAAVDRARKLRSALSDVQCALMGGPDLTPRAPAALQSPEETVADSRLRAAVAELTRAESDLAVARANGYLDRHPRVVRLRGAIGHQQALVKRLTEESRALRLAAAPGAQPLTSLAERESSLRAHTQKSEDEVRRLATQRAALVALEGRAAATGQSLSETDARLDALATEASLGSRLTVVLSGDRAMAALLDNRPKMAAAGALFGGAAPLAALVLCVAARRRYGHGTDVAADLQGHIPFVALVPELNGDPALNGAAAHCIHDLRVRLQPQGEGASRVYVITSVSASGEGRSSVSLALALSFAASGYRTLLIDGDLASRQISRGFGAEDCAGLIEAATGGDPVIRRVRTGLSILPAGRARPEDACRLAPGATARLIALARERFDVVLIDSDPIVTGLTGSVLAPQADGVVLTLARGQLHSLTHRAVRGLEMGGARIVGAVFNRASPSDLRSVLAAHPAHAQEKQRLLPERLRRFGPLVSAMLATLRLSREEDLDLMPTEMTLARTDAERRAAPDTDKRAAA